MQSSIAIALLATAALAHTPGQVKDELDAHPWRPAPTMAVVDAPAPPAEPVARPAAVPAPEAEAAVWQLQVAALSSIEAAKAEQKRIEKLVGDAKVEIFSDGSIHRVRLGAYPSKQAAEAAREELRPKGIDGFPVQKP